MAAMPKSSLNFQIQSSISENNMFVYTIQASKQREQVVLLLLLLACQLPPLGMETFHNFFQFLGYVPCGPDHLESEN